MSAESTHLEVEIHNITNGDLTIRKVVSGNRGDASRYFTFDIQLDDETINGLYGTVMFTNGYASISLRHGQTITIPDLPGLVGYTITEVQANQDGYTTTDSGNTTGVILPSDTITVSFENRNHYDPDPEIPSTWTPDVQTNTAVFNFVNTADE